MILNILFWIWDKLGWAHTTIMVKPPDEAILCRRKDKWRFLAEGYKEWQG